MNGFLAERGDRPTIDKEYLMRAGHAVDWMQKHGRVIDQRCVAIDLGESDTSKITDGLSAYQNPDGGFGHALEPDLRLAGSSVLASTIALQLLTRYAFDNAVDLLDRLAAFLERTYDQDTAAWPIVPPEVSDAPHAPWWNHRPSSQCKVNPRAEILGYLLRWPSLTSGSTSEIDTERITAEIAEHVATTTTVEMHELMVLNRLFAAPELPRALKDQWERFLDLARQTIPRDRQDWKGYTLTPLTIIDSPNHPLADQFAGPIQQNIDYLWSQQTTDGSWDPPWNWGASQPDAWRTAERDVRSVITARTIRQLHRFDAFN